MAEQSDCPCPDSSPTPTRGDGGKALPSSSGEGTARMQLMAEISRNPDGSSVLGGVGVTPQKALKVHITGAFLVAQPNIAKLSLDMVTAAQCATTINEILDLLVAVGAMTAETTD